MKNSAGFKQILIIAFILIAIMPVTLISSISLQILTSTMEKEISDKNNTIANSVSGEVEKFLEEPAGLLKQIASVIEHNLLINTDKTGMYLDSILESYRFFDGLKILDNSGKVLFTSPYNRDFIGIDLSMQPFFRNRKKAKTPVWSSTYISVETGQPTLTLTLPFNKGLITGHLNLSYLENIVNRIKPGSFGYAAITDKDGTLIAHPKRSHISQQVNFSNIYAIKMGLEGKPGTYLFKFNNTDWIGSVSIISQTGWVACVFQRFEDAFSSVIKIKFVILIGTIIFIILAIALCLVIVKRIMTPLSSLIKYSKNISIGNYSISDMPHSYHEINELAENFKIMAVAVQSRETELAAEKLFIDAALNSLTDTFFVFNPSTGKPIRWNEPFCRVSGYTDDEISKMKAPDNYYSRDDLKKAEIITKEILSKGKGSIELSLITKNGERIPTEYSASVIKDKKGNPRYIISVGRDIRERKKLEAQLQQAHKMEAIGTIAGGIAHDFNNILGIIIGNAELAIDGVPEWNPSHNNIVQIVNASLRAKDVVSQLLSFSRMEIHKPKPVIIHDIIHESVNLIRSSIPSSIEIIHDISDTRASILADPTQIHQMLLNLCTNAFHAMEENGGELEIRMTEVDLNREQSNGYHKITPGKYVKIVVSDTGCGIPADIKNKIFDPYFTTKEVGKGSGMGLSIVHGVVKSNKGMISVYSEPGKGTSFKVFFPVISGDNEIKRDESIELPKGNERILFVDDEEFLLDIGSQILNKLGYIVETSSNPIEALDLFRSKPDFFDLLITDMTMPELSGDVFAQEIKMICPDIPVILCTGFSNKINSETAREIGIDKYIEKPLSIHKMAFSIREVLDK